MLQFKMYSVTNVQRKFLFYIFRCYVSFFSQDVTILIFQISRMAKYYNTEHTHPFSYEQVKHLLLIEMTECLQIVNSAKYSKNWMKPVLTSLLTSE